MFHWHIVDSQSFPLVVDGFPELAEHGAYSSSEVYSQADVADIVSYAGAVRISSIQLLSLPPHHSLERHRCYDGKPAVLSGRTSILNLRLSGN